ncbi:MAG: hypothetical protein U9O94_02515 [Nanoarchaeota archaeon]|nr:hypothetical protein [Nanoarchaeota archaeon]
MFELRPGTQRTMRDLGWKREEIDSYTRVYSKYPLETSMSAQVLVKGGKTNPSSYFIEWRLLKPTEEGRQVDLAGWAGFNRDYKARDWLEEVINFELESYLTGGCNIEPYQSVYPQYRITTRRIPLSTYFSWPPVCRFGLEEGNQKEQKSEPLAPEPKKPEVKISEVPEETVKYSFEDFSAEQLSNFAREISPEQLKRMSQEEETRLDKLLFDILSEEQFGMLPAHIFDNLYERFISTHIL